MVSMEVTALFPLAPYKKKKSHVLKQLLSPSFYSKFLVYPHKNYKGVIKFTTILYDRYFIYGTANS